MRQAFKYTTLADVYAAILKGEIDTEDTSVLVDGGDFMIYEDGVPLFECSYDLAMEFVSDILGIGYEHL